MSEPSESTLQRLKQAQVRRKQAVATYAAEHGCTVEEAAVQIKAKEKENRDFRERVAAKAPRSHAEAHAMKAKRSKNPAPVTLAHKFVAQHMMTPKGLVLRRWQGGMYMWSASHGCYRELSEDRVSNMIYERLPDTVEDPTKCANVRKSLIAVDELLIDETPINGWIGDAPEGFGNSSEVVACPNGLLNLATDDGIESTPRYFTLSGIGTEYDPDAPEPSRWLGFLGQVLPNDPEAIATLQEWFGLMLTPDISQHKIMLLIGQRRCGKGTISRVLTALLGGSDNVAAPTLSSLAEPFGLAPLLGKTAAIIGDARLDGRSDVAQILEALLSISGEDPKDVQRKFLKSWSGYLQVRFTILSNELPRFNDPSGAIGGRMLVLNLPESFYGREDHSLTSALLGELPGILNWAIEGWRRLRECGRLVQPKSSAHLVEQLDTLSSPVRGWMSECCDLDASLWISTADAYASYSEWALGTGVRPQSREMFGRDLHATGMRAGKKRQADGKAPPGYYGLALQRDEVERAIASFMRGVRRAMARKTAEASSGSADLDPRV